MSPAKAKERWWWMRLYGRNAFEHLTITMPSRIGMEQFWQQESTGEEPSSPSPYYHRLRSGKQWVGRLQKQYKELWHKPTEWGILPWTGTFYFALEMDEKLFNVLIPFLPFPKDVYAARREWKERRI